MRKLSFLSLCFITSLSLVSCTKDAVPRNPIAGPTVIEPQNAYTVAYSEWEREETLTWSDGMPNAEPSRRAELSASRLTQHSLQDGSIVFVYAKSIAGDVVSPMPVTQFGTSGEVDTYVATAALPGAIEITRTRSVNGVSEMPTGSRNFSFRYIIVTPVQPDPNGRVPVVADFASLSYEELVALFNIPG